MRSLLKLAAWAFVAVVFLSFLAVFMVSKSVVTAQDARVSHDIHVEFEAALTTNLPAGKHVAIISSPRRDGIAIYVSGGNLTQDERQKLISLATAIAKEKENRKARLIFRD